jgi:phosphotransferase system enzyme I (PtsI)
MQLQGIIASEGISIGKLKKIGFKKIYTEKGSEAKEVFSILKKNLINKIESTKNISKETNEIFEIYKAILMDPYFEELIDKNLENGDNLSESIEASTVEIIDLMSSTNAYMKERSSDIQRLGIVLQNPINEIESGAFIFYNDSLAVIDFLSINVNLIEGIITQSGSKISHLAIWARNNNIPYVYNIDITKLTDNSDSVITKDGKLIIEPPAEILNQLKEEKINRIKIIEKSMYFQKKNLFYKNKKITIAANIGSLEDGYVAAERKVNGVGLFRTEFMFLAKDEPLSEEEQYKIYKETANLFNDTVIIRTLDIGGDKELKYLSLEKELNPFLGIRGLRLSLEFRDLFKIQLRAILRAAYECNNIAIMFPMVTIEDEIKKAKSIIEECKKELSRENKNYKVPSIGIMIEVPSAALNADNLIESVDFMSIGTNDLIQYTMAMDRTNNKVSYLYLPHNNAIIKLIKNVIDVCHQNKKRVGMCGSMAGEMIYYPLLLELCLDEFSMESSQISFINMYHTYLMEHNIANILPWNEKKIEILQNLLDDFWIWLKEKNFSKGGTIS